MIINGLDSTGRYIRGRCKLRDEENITVVVTVVALKELFGLTAYGALVDIKSFRAFFIEPFITNPHSMGFLSGPKSATSNETEKSLKDAEKEIGANNLSDIIRNFLQRQAWPKLEDYLKDPKNNKDAHSLFFNIAYLDLGLTNNVGNKNYESMQEKKEIPLGRAGDKLGIHLLIFAKAGFLYQNPFVDTSLNGDIKFMQTDMKEKPEKDKLRFELGFKLPWDSLIFEDSSYSLSPIWINGYEAKPAPVPLLSNKTPDEPRSKRRLIPC